MSKRLAPGTRVTCRYRGAHQGVVLSDANPRCWANTAAFPTDSPDPDKVEAHVEHCKAQGWGGWTHQPVLWDFGKIYWDDHLIPVGMSAAVTDEEVAVG